MKDKNIISKQCLDFLRIVWVWPILLVAILYSPYRAIAATQVSSHLEFRTLPPDFDSWSVSTKDGEGAELTGHLDIPSVYSGRDQFNEYHTLPVTVIAGINSYITTVSIPNSITEITDNGFSGSPNLKSVVIPNSVTSVGVYAFKECPKLSSVVLSPNNNCTSSFVGCDIKKGAYPIGKRSFVADIEVAYPADCIPDSDGLIYNKDATTFYFAPWNIKTLELPSTVSAIGQNAFAGCTQLNILVVRSTIPPTVSDGAFDSARIGVIRVPYGTKEAYDSAPGWADVSSRIIEFADPESITLNTSDATLNVSESIKLIATVEPDYSSITDITWESSNPNVATVDNDGTVTAIALGTATITATCGPVSATCKINVVETEPTQITLDRTSALLKVNETVQLTATVHPDTAMDKTIIWRTENNNIASVDTNGLVKAIAPGETYITATCGGATDKCRIVVSETPSEDKIELNFTSVELEKSKTLRLIAKIYSENETTDNKFVWSSSNRTVADVDAKGMVAALSLGHATITVTSSNGLSSSCEIYVNSDAEDIMWTDTTVGILKYEHIYPEKSVRVVGATDDNIENLVIPDYIIYKEFCYKVTVINRNAFKDCTSITGDLKIGNYVKSIEESAFEGCTGLTGNLTIPNSVTGIGAQAFYGCTGFNGSLTIGDAVSVIGEKAFYRCSGITGPLKFGGNLNLIKDYAFFMCSGLTGSLVIPSSTSLIYIGPGAFWGTKISELYLSESVSRIRTYAFNPLYTLKKVECRNVNPPRIDIGAFFDSHTQDIQLFVPIESIQSYKDADEWNKFYDITGIGEVLAEYVLLNESEVTLPLDQTLQLEATVFPENTSFKSVTWHSSDESICTVDETGKVSPIQCGAATIEARTFHGKTSQCLVTVSPSTTSGIYYSEIKDEQVIKIIRTIDGVAFTSLSQNEVRIIISGLDGKVVYHRYLNEKNDFYDTCDLGKGMYIIHVESNDGCMTQKILVQ